MKLNLRWFYVPLITLIVSNSFAQTTLYVSSTGSDSPNDCQTPGNPCNTIGYALTQSVNGDVIKLSPGTYNLSATLNLNQEIVLTALDPADKPIITSTTSDIININSDDVTISNLNFQMGLTATTGMKGIVATQNFDNVKILDNKFESIHPITGTPNANMVWNSYAISLYSDAGNIQNVEIRNNEIIASNSANIFGRGIFIGNGSLGKDAPGGIIEGNTVTAYYTIQSAKFSSDINISNNTLNGISMINAPKSGVTITIDNNTFSGNTQMTPSSLYALVELRSVNDANVIFSNNALNNYSNIGFISESSKNVTVSGNTFNPETSANNFISLMVNTKFMTNGTQNNTYADEISITGNTFNAGVVNTGTAIIFADHYGVNTPAFGNVTIGGPVAADKNIFNANLGKYIILDDNTGTSTTYPLWASYASTTMKPVAQDFTALAIHNNYNLVNFSAIEAKMTDVAANPILGEIIIRSDDNIRYVATNGNDISNDCTLPGNPCATIAHALSMSVDSDTIQVAAGTYLQNSILTVNQNNLTVRAESNTNKPVITTDQTTIFDINASEVSLIGLRMELGLTATTGKYGVVSTTNNFNKLEVSSSEFISTSPAIPYGMVWDAFAVRLNSPLSTTQEVTISNNTIGTATPTGNNVFGRGISIGSGSTDGPGGEIINNEIKAYYAIQAIRSNNDLTINGNTINGISMINAPLTGVNVLFEENTVDAVSTTYAESLYSLVEIRSAENGNVTIHNNDFLNYVNIGLLSSASKNVSVLTNTFTPEATADEFISIMANTKIMTNGAQGNTYADEIIIKGNIFNADETNTGTAIVFADHYGVNTPAFGTVTIGGLAIEEKNFFHFDLTKTIVLDGNSGASTAYPLWAGYTATTMKPVAQNIEAFANLNNFNAVSFTDIKTKMTDVEDNQDLGEIIIKSTGKTRYVAMNGDDNSNDCTLPGFACATVLHALDLSVDADTIQIGGGTFFQSDILNITQNNLTIRGESLVYKPIITTHQTTVFDINATGVNLAGLKVELGLTATTGKYGIISNSGNFNDIKIVDNEFLSTSPVIPYGMVWDAFAIQLNSATSEEVTISNNIIGTATPTGNNVFGRGISIGSGSTDGPGGEIINNEIKAYYAIQAIRSNNDLTINGNTINGISMINAPLTGVNVLFEENTVDAVSATYAESLYSLVEIRSVENGNVTIQNNDFLNYVNIGLLSSASKNVSVLTNTFTPEATADEFISIMANTKIMTNGVQGDTYGNEIEIIGNEFEAGAANEGTAIIFADHYGATTPAFGTVTIGGTGATDKNVFNTNLGNYIVLDDKTGPSDAVSLWAPYAVTTMKPVSQDIEALYINNNYNLPHVDDVEVKNIDSLDNNVLGKIILGSDFLGLGKMTTETIKLYPNPTSNFITIETDGKKSVELTIVDLLGNVVLTTNVNGSKTINVENLTSGVYIVRLNGNNETTKFVKK